MMNRRQFLSAIALLGGSVLFSCKHKNADSPIPYYESQLGSLLTLEGDVIHVCPVNGKKMKLRLSDGEVMRVVPIDNKPFDLARWNKQHVRVTGKLSDLKVSREYIADNYAEKKLLCHIDHTPCIDTEWAENHWKNGSGSRILDRDNNALQMKMLQSGKDYIQVFVITAEKIEVC